MNNTESPRRGPLRFCSAGPIVRCVCGKCGTPGSGSPDAVLERRRIREAELARAEQARLT